MEWKPHSAIVLEPCARRLVAAVADGALLVFRRHDLKSTQEVASGVLGRGKGGEERRRGVRA